MTAPSPRPGRHTLRLVVQLPDTHESRSALIRLALCCEEERDDCGDLLPHRAEAYEKLRQVLEDTLAKSLEGT